MRQIYTFFYLLVAVFALGLLFGCNKPGQGEDVADDTTRYDWCPLRYQLTFEVVDQNGQNIFSGEQVQPIEGASAEVWHCQNGHYLENVLLNSNVAGINYFVLMAWSVEYVNLGVAVEDATIISKIRCKEVFGDDQVRTIEAKWEKKKFGPLACTSFTLEGKTYYPEVFGSVRLVVNR